MCFHPLPRRLLLPFSVTGPDVFRLLESSGRGLMLRRRPETSDPVRYRDSHRSSCVLYRVGPCATTESNSVFLAVEVFAGLQDGPNEYPTEVMLWVDCVLREKRSTEVVSRGQRQVGSEVELMDRVRRALTSYFGTGEAPNEVLLGGGADDQGGREELL